MEPEKKPERKFKPLFKGATRCPECGSPLYADVNEKGDSKGLSCMKINDKTQCIAYGITRTVEAK